MMKPGDSAELTIDSVAPGGEGVGRLDGLAVFVPFSAPGDILKIRIQEAHRSYARAGIEELLRPGACRSPEAYCPWLGRCGGCDLGHLRYDFQVEAKRAWLAAQLGKAGLTEVPEIRLHTAEALGYRHRVQFRHGPSGRPAYSEAQSNRLIEPERCPVAVEAINRWLGDCAAGRAAVPVSPDRYTVIASGSTVKVQGLDGEFALDFMQHRFVMHPERFFQSNLGLLPRLVELVTAGQAGRLAADLYCGVGLFSAWLVDSFERLHCVELDSDAVRLAGINTGGRAALHAGSIDEWLRLPAAAGRFDYLVLDPPRSGLSGPVRDWLAERGAPDLAYVSCNAQALGRDLAALSRFYTVTDVHLFDFYPNTSHIESCALLHRRKGL